MSILGLYICLFDFTSCRNSTKCGSVTLHAGSILFVCCFVFLLNTSCHKLWLSFSASFVFPMSGLSVCSICLFVSLFLLVSPWHKLRLSRPASFIFPMSGELFLLHVKLVDASALGSNVSDQGSVDDNHQVSHGKSDIIGKAEEMRVDDGVDDGGDDGDDGSVHNNHQVSRGKSETIRKAVFFSPKTRVDRSELERPEFLP